MTLLLLALELGMLTTILFGGAISGAAVAAVGLAIVFSFILELIAAAVRVTLRRRAAEELKKKMAAMLTTDSGGHGTYL